MFLLFFGSGIIFLAHWAGLRIVLLNSFVHIDHSAFLYCILFSNRCKSLVRLLLVIWTGSCEENSLILWISLLVSCLGSHLLMVSRSNFWTFIVVLSSSRLHSLIVLIHLIVWWLWQSWLTFISLITFNVYIVDTCESLVAATEIAKSFFFTIELFVVNSIACCWLRILIQLIFKVFIRQIKVIYVLSDILDHFLLHITNIHR